MKRLVRERLMLVLSIASIAALVVGILIPAVSLAFTSNIPQTVLLIGAIFFLLGCLAGVAAWIASLVKSAFTGEWGWFVAIVLFNVVGALAYAIGEREVQRPAH